jgi:uncharacterized protein (TIGR03067 family)
MKTLAALICLMIAVSLGAFHSLGAQEKKSPPPIWQTTTEDLLRSQKPGYGGLCGVVVDHQTGDVIVNVSDCGFFRSTDQGQTWKRLGAEIKGRTEWPGCLQLDPTGKTKTLASALVYGSPIVVSAAGDGKWTALDKKSSHVDWFALDWADPEHSFVLALKHESGGLLLASRDGGKTFDEVGKGYAAAWVFDARTAVVAEAKSKDRPKPGLLRTTDAAKTFQPCGDWSATALPKWQDGTLYWLVDGALIVSKDQGVTWEKRGDLKAGRVGPILGKDAQHLLVLTAAEIVESTDGGATWPTKTALPKDLKGVSALTWLDYDPTHDVIYVMKMGSQLFKLERGGGQGGPAKTDLEKLRGSWLTVSQVVDGKTLIDEKTPPKDGPPTKLVYEGEKWMIQVGDKTVATGNFKIDAAKTPKEIDVMDAAGKKTFVGIYEVEGDRYKFCIVPAGKTRPTEFTSKEGSGNIMIVNKREK